MKIIISINIFRDDRVYYSFKTIVIFDGGRGGDLQTCTVKHKMIISAEIKMLIFDVMIDIKDPDTVQWVREINLVGRETWK